MVRKITNEATQTILMTIISEGGKISLTDPNDNTTNTTKVVVDVLRTNEEQIFWENLVL